MGTKPAKAKLAARRGGGGAERGSSKAKPAAKRRARTDTALDLAVQTALATFAHDVRTPLTGILALAELLDASGLGERERRWAASLKGAAEHLAALTTLVVDAARPDIADVVGQRHAFDLRSLLTLCGDAIAARAQAKGLTCRVEIADSLPQRAVGNAVRLRTLIENVADNAVKFTTQGGVTMKAAVTGARGKRLRLRIAISDTGIGMSPAEIKRLFRPFAQANKTIAGRFGGAGLGLALGKRVAQAMGGDLRVVSTLGHGSTFTFDVMLDAAVATAGAGEANNVATPHRRLRLLCVEDNPYARVVMNTILTELGHAVDFAASGEAACEAVAKHRYDAVLMDIELPGIDGLESSRRIRAMNADVANVPIIAISGHDNDEGESAAAARLDGYLRKPAGPAALAAMLAKVTAPR